MLWFSSAELAPSAETMKLAALIIFTSVLVAHYASSLNLSIPGERFLQWMDGKKDFTRLGEANLRDMDERSTSEDDKICFLLKEKDLESHISCQHRLTRSKFNYNPFGLRFGKRNRRLKAERTGTRKILPVLLFVRELEEAS